MCYFSLQTTAKRLGIFIAPYRGIEPHLAEPIGYGVYTGSQSSGLTGRVRIKVPPSSLLIKLISVTFLPLGRGED
ncbi:hypothetical protein [Sphingobacterium sp.]|uniref:hypothetical protein n=1 Tax=Sphingobacterium sp. TaxID=341027 RepID=UPI0028A6188B|nr:hypothetical protein [Sphingobacterium sp.]